MKKLSLSILAVAMSMLTVNAQDLPAPSPFAKVFQRVGLTDVEVEYSRPGVKGRTIFGGLEAYDEVWRTGANSATTIELSTDAKIGGVDVKAGTYSMFTIPGKTDWKLMINTDTRASEGSYKAENNVAEVSMKSMASPMTESLEFSFDNVKENSADLVFEWEKVKWSVAIEVAVEEQAMANIDNKIKEIEGAYGVYNSSANYYLSHNKDLDKALMWSKKSIEISERFWNVHTLAKIYAAKGDKKMAIETAEKSKALAEKASYKPYVKMNEELIAKMKK